MSSKVQVTSLQVGREREGDLRPTRAPLPLPIRPARQYGRGAMPLEVVQAMHAEFLATQSLAAVGRKFGRSSRAVSQMLAKHGLYQPKPPTRTGAARDPRTNKFIPGAPLTDAQIVALIAAEKTFRIPRALRAEWRDKPMERKAWIIGLLREKFRNPKRDRPTTPFSANVEPFDYATPRAWEIIHRTNEGVPSRYWSVRLFPNSWGVIWREQLWFWCPYSHASGRSGSYQAGKFVRGQGRPQLHHAIWREAHGAPVPPGHVVRFIDGNPNNLAPQNLTLATKNDVVRETQAHALKKKSRRLTAALLQRHEKRDENEHHPLHQLKR